MSASKLYAAAKDLIERVDSTAHVGAVSLVTEMDKLREVVASYRDPVNYGFEGWHGGEAPTDFFDAGKWLECLHAILPALSHVDDELRDTGLLHELTHLALGLEIGIENRVRLLREKILEIQGTFPVKSAAKISGESLTREQLQDLGIRNIVIRLQKADNYTHVQAGADLRRLFGADPHPGIEIAESTVRDAARLATILGHVHRGYEDEWIVRPGRPHNADGTKHGFLRAVDGQLV